MAYIDVYPAQELQSETEIVTEADGYGQLTK
jgi:hypothetical protein